MIPLSASRACSFLQPLAVVAGLLVVTGCPTKADPSKGGASEPSAPRASTSPTPPAASSAPTGWDDPGPAFRTGAPFTILMHADTPYQLMKGKSMEKETDVHMSFERLRKGHVSAFAAVLFVESKFHDQGAAAYCRRATKKIDDLLEAHRDNVRPALASDDFEDNWRSGHVSLLRTLEGSWCLGGSDGSIDALHASGIRMIDLTWENDHDFATSWTYHGHVGLTARGRKAVARMNELGIAVDVSHMSDRAVDDVLAVSKAPVFATHSNARAVCNHPRNLKDEHIRAIAKTGGVIGVNFYPLHLVKGGTATVADVVRHIRHLREVGGIDSVGLGSDFDGIGRGPSGLETAAELVNLRKALRDDGFTDAQVAAIFGGNFLRAMAGVERVARR